MFSNFNPIDFKMLVKMAEWTNVLFEVKISVDPSNVLNVGPHPRGECSMQPLSNYFGHMCG